MSAGRWLGNERTQLAAERILDAAGELFCQEGVAATGMEDVAKAAGCSRATLYRYFDDREALRREFVHREARRVGTRVAEAVSRITNPEDRVVEAVMRAVSEVRAQPVLRAWFASTNLDATRGVVASSAVIEGLAASLLGSLSDPEAAGWLVRTVMSLLLVPGRDESEERRLIRRFVAPTVLTAS